MQNHRLLTDIANERAAIYLTYGIVASMLVCAAVPLIDLGERLFPSWDGRYLLPFCFVVALEGLLSWRASGKFTFPALGWFLYRGAEFVVILMGLKAYIYNHRGWDRLWADLPLWQDNFNTFFGGEYFFACVLVIMVWLVAIRFAIDLSDLEGDEQLLQLERDSGVQSDRAAARRRVITDIFIAGGVMIFFTAVLRSNLAFMGIAWPVFQTGLLNVVLYFVLGLVLLALSQFALLRARWSLDRIPLAHNLALRWAAYSAVLLVVSAAIAILLPTRYSLDLLDTLALIIAIVQFLLYLLLLLLLLPVQLLFSLLFGRTPNLPPVPEPPPEFPSIAPAESSGPVPWLEILQPIAFWAVFLGVLGFSLYYYLRQRADLVAALDRLPGWKWLRGFWRWLRGGVTAINAGIAGAIRSVADRRRRAAIAPWHYISLRRLSPRDRVRFFYLAMIRRASDSVSPRRPAETPFEYESKLAAQLPPTHDDIASLTAAFVEARYSRHEITSQSAKSARDHWENIRRALRNRRASHTKDDRR